MMSRRVLILAHTGREESLKAAWEACALLHESGLVPVLQENELGDMVRFFGRLDHPVEVLHDHVKLPEVELVMVLGGDGTILRAAELVREVDVPATWGSWPRANGPTSPRPSSGSPAVTTRWRSA